MTEPDRDDDAGYPNPRYAWYVVSVLTVAYLLSFLDRQILALLVEPIRIAQGYARVPAAPGLGVEVDEAALDRYRMEPPYALPQPRLLLTVTWPGDRVRHYASIQQCWTDAANGNIPPQERGARSVSPPAPCQPSIPPSMSRALKPRASR